MSNLKKVTALSLALVSVLGTIASATFADQSDIDATDAVDTLSALGIINGYTDGTFRPEGTVTRAEMAKMIFTIKNGGNDDASAFAGISSSFTDIKGHWAEGYIKYCQTQGIIAGKSATTFAPDQKVTGTESLKMALTLLGYRADKSGLTGSAWAANTLAIASEEGLTTDYAQSFAAASQRQYAAQVLYNALYTNTVSYSALIEDYVDGSTLAVKNMNLETKTAVLGEGKTITLTVDGNTVEVKLNKDSSAYIGQEVEVLFNKTKKQAYGVKPTDKNKVIKATGSAITIDNNGAAKYDGTTINLTGATYNEKSAGTDYTVADITGSNFVTIVDNGISKNVYIEPVNVRTVTAVNSERVIAGASYTFKDNTIAANVKKDDVVSITTDRYNQQPKLTVLSKTTGDVTATKTGEVRVGTTWYKLGTNNGAALAIGNSVEFYVVNGYVFNAKATSVEVTNQDYVVVTRVADTTDTLADTIKAIATMADGTEKTITVSKIDGAKVTTGNVVANTLYSFEMDGTNYKLSTPAASKTVSITDVTGFEFNATNDTLAGMPILDDAVVYVKSTVAGETTMKVLTGKTVAAWSDSINLAGTAVTKDINGVKYVDVAYLQLTVAIPGTSSDEMAGLVVADSYQVKVDGQTKYEVEIFNGKETVTYRSDSAITATKGSYVTFKVNTDGKTLSTIATSTAADAAVTGVNGNRVSINGVTYTVNDSTKVVYVNSKDVKGVESGEILVADYTTLDDGTKQYNNNVKVKFGTGDNAGTIDTIYVDVNNAMGTGTFSVAPMYTVTFDEKFTAKIGSTSIASGDKVDKNTVVTVTYTAPTAPSSGETVKINGVAAIGDVNGTNTVFTADVIITANTTISATVAP